MGGSGTGGLSGQSGESDAVTPPSPPPAASSAGRGDVGVLRGHPGRRGGIGEDTTLPSLSPVAPSTEGDTSGLRSQSEEWRKSDRLDIPAQQDNPRSQPRRHTVTPAVTRSAARAQLGVGDQPGAFTVLSTKESISAAIATSAAPHSDSPELPTCPTCDLETPATHAQAHAGPHSKIWGAARAPASADGIAASAEAAEPATSGNVPSAASVGGGSRGARVVRWSGAIGRGDGSGTIDRRYCCPCCVNGEGDQSARVSSWVRWRNLRREGGVHPPLRSRYRVSARGPLLQRQPVAAWQ